MAPHTINTTVVGRQLGYYSTVPFFFIKTGSYSQNIIYKRKH